MKKFFLASAMSICLASTPFADTCITDIGKYALCVENLRLRSAQDTGATALATLPKGTRVIINSIGLPFTTDGIADNWCHVLLDDGREGWCFGGYLSPGDRAFGSIATQSLWESASDAEQATALSPDGRHASVLFDKTDEEPARLEVVRADSGILLKKYESDINRPASPGLLVFSPDSKQLFFGQTLALKRVQLRNLSDASYPIPFSNQYTYLEAIAITDDGRLCVCLGDRGELALCDATTGSCSVFPGEIRGDSCVICPDGKGFVIGGLSLGGWNLERYDIATKSLVWQSETSGSPICWSRDGKKLYVLGDSLYEIDAMTGKESSRARLDLEIDEPIRGGAYAPQTGLLAICNGTDVVYFVDLDGGNVLQAIKYPDLLVESVSISADGTRLALSGTNSLEYFESHRAQTKENSWSLMGKTAVFSVSLERRTGAPSGWRDTVASEAGQLADFLLQNTFFSDALVEASFDDAKYLNFEKNGQYVISLNTYTKVRGAFSLTGNKLMLYPIQLSQETAREYNVLFDDLRRLNLADGDGGASFTVDPFYADFFHQGILRPIGEGYPIISMRESPSDRAYEFQGVSCVKFGGYFAPKKNLPIRKTPSLSSPSDSIGLIDSELGIDIEKRALLFKDEILFVHGHSAKTETINGVTGYWYLVVVYDEYAPYAKSVWAWVFGIDGVVFQGDDYDRFDAIRKANLPLTLREAGYAVGDRN